MLLLCDTVRFHSVFRFGVWPRRTLGFHGVLELRGPGIEAEDCGDLAQDGVGLLEAGDPAGQSGLVALTGHTHGIDSPLLHCRAKETGTKQKNDIKDS